MLVRALILATLVAATPAHAEDGECRTVADLAHAAAAGGWTLSDDLKGPDAEKILSQFPQPLPGATDEVVIFEAPDGSSIVIAGLAGGCLRWSVPLRAAGNEI